MGARAAAKSVLQHTGLFPWGRSAYRTLNPQIRKQRRTEIAFYSEFLPPGALCFDIGANLGQKTEVFRACGARVIVVEPNPNCQSTLRYHFAADKDCTLVESAVGGIAGTASLFVSSTEATGSLRSDWDQKIFGISRDVPSVRVSVVTLDTLIERFGVPEFTKIDVEGYEIEVLRGLTKPLPLISFEYHAREMERSERCLNMLSQLGSLSIRASDMNCRWISDRIDPPTTLNGLKKIVQHHNGDMFVWVDHQPTTRK